MEQDPTLAWPCNLLSYNFCKCWWSNSLTWKWWKARKIEIESLHYEPRGNFPLKYFFGNELTWQNLNKASIAELESVSVQYRTNIWDRVDSRSASLFFNKSECYVRCRFTPHPQTEPESFGRDYCLVFTVKANVTRAKTLLHVDLIQFYALIWYKPAGSKCCIC